MVRCAKCGFLSLAHIDDRSLCEADATTRETGELPIAGNPTRCLRAYGAVCFVGAANLNEEMERDHKEELLGVIQAERECSAFTPWIQGSSPKEHKQMLEHREMQTWQEEQRERDRAWQEEQREKDRGWQEEQKRSERHWQEEQNKANRRWQLAVALIASTIGVLIGRFLSWK